VGTGPRGPLGGAERPSRGPATGVPGIEPYAAGRALWRDHAAEIGESLAVRVPGLAAEDMETIMEYLSRARREHGPGRAGAPAGDVAG